MIDFNEKWQDNNLFKHQKSRNVKQFNNQLNIRSSHNSKQLSKSLLSFSKGTMPAFEESFALFDFPVYLINGHDDTKYIKLIDNISCENNSRIWWASEIASKNRFTSNLQESLFQFVQSVNAINNLECDTLVILSPTQYLMKPLYKYGKNLKRKVFPISYGSIYKIFFFDNIYLYLRLIKQALIIYLRSIRARLNIKLKHNKGELYSKNNCLIKTHVHEGSFDDSNRYQDKYFGKLPEFLSKKSDLIFFVHIHGDYNSVLKKIRNNSIFNVGKSGAYFCINV